MIIKFDVTYRCRIWEGTILLLKFKGLTMSQPYLLSTPSTCPVCH